MVNLDKKLHKLLEIAGINITGYKYDSHDPKIGSKDLIWWFKELRNDATHPRGKRDWTEDEIDVILGNAIHWVEEVILRRLGYNGVYRDRSRGMSYFTYPRYKLNMSDESW